MTRSQRAARVADELAQIVARANTYGERLARVRRTATSQALPPAALVDSSLADRRLAEWAQRVTDGDRHVLRYRLAWDGIELAVARRSLDAIDATRHLQPRATDDRWPSLLATALADERGGGADVQADTPADARAAAHADTHAVALRPLLHRAHEALCARLGANAMLLSPLAERDLLAALASRLMEAAAPTFEFERAIARSLAYGHTSSPSADGSLAALARSYPVLVRLLCESALRWTDAAAEMVERYVRDWPGLRSLTMNDAAEPAPIARVECDLSDRHCDGRAVHVLVLARGNTIVYKPRTLLAEVMLARVIDWLASRDAPGERAPRLCAVPALDRGTHGWMARAESRALDSPVAADRFAERAGMLAAVAWLLALVDLHQGNVVFDGEYPLIVDAEAMLHPALDDTRGESLRRLGLLPGSYLAPDGRDMSAFARIARPDAAGHARRGARWVLRRVADARRELLASHGPLAPLRAVEGRVILRPTHVYRGLVRGALAPAVLTDGAEWHIGLDSIARDVVRLRVGSEPSRWWRLVAHERRALEALDVPRFSARATARHISGIRRATDGSADFPLTGWRALRDRVAMLDHRLVRELSSAIGHAMARSASSSSAGSGDCGGGSIGASTEGL